MTGGVVGEGNIVMAHRKSPAQVPTVAAFRWTTQRHVTQTLGKVRMSGCPIRTQPHKAASGSGNLSGQLPVSSEKYLEMDPHPTKTAPGLQHHLSLLVKASGITPAPPLPLTPCEAARGFLKWRSNHTILASAQDPPESSPCTRGASLGFAVHTCRCGHCPPIQSLLSLACFHYPSLRCTGLLGFLALRDPLHQQLL